MKNAIDKIGDINTKVVCERFSEEKIFKQGPK